MSEIWTLEDQACPKSGPIFGLSQVTKIQTATKLDHFEFFYFSKKVKTRRSGFWTLGTIKVPKSGMDQSVQKLD